MTYHIIINFSLFDRNHWAEFDMEEKPLLIYNIKKRLKKKILEKDNQGNKIEEQLENDKTLMELKFWEITVDKIDKWCWIVKYIWASEEAYPNKRRYFKYGTRFNDKKQKLHVVKTEQLI